MATTFAEARADYIAARLALAAAKAAWLVARTQFNNASEALQTLDPGDAGFLVATLLVKNRQATLEQARADWETATNTCAVALKECLTFAA